jgi:hypothetical protein
MKLTALAWRDSLHQKVKTLSANAKVQMMCIASVSDVIGR